MSRIKNAIKKNYFHDPKLNEKIVTKFIKQLMIQGKNSVAEKIFYGSFDIVG